MEDVHTRYISVFSFHKLDVFNLMNIFKNWLLEDIYLVLSSKGYRIFLILN